MTAATRIFARTLTGLLAVSLLIAAGCTQTAEYTAHDIAGIMPDLEFDLTNENGQPVTEADFDGDLKLLFFGYTYCPDICPATLSRVRAALGGLDEAQRKDIDVLFVSVDPERDTPERLEAYTANFGPQFTGLTGTEEQLEALTRRFRVTYGYGKPNENGFYLVSHSSAIFVFDEQGRVRLLVNQGETVDQLTTDLEKLLAATDP